ncbi:hypothetical protein SAMN05421579_10154 [Xenorhabdus japonica]|uniref:Uncharacterized protein n=1 Tax=Xenorhabdus japonica TaxID=53341 RepID=A0A1I4Y8X3_9GAMM|nr:hypothetical protein SAMN05421579_10154 [Xenorhabdus japonica]
MYRNYFGTWAYLIVLGVGAKSSDPPSTSSSEYGGATFKGLFGWTYSPKGE